MVAFAPMIHFLPVSDTAAALPQSAVAQRAGGLARALEAVEQVGGECRTSASDLVARIALADGNGLIDHVSERAVAASAAGLEAIAALAEAGGTANPAAARLLADTIRDALDEMGALLSL